MRKYIRDIGKHSTVYTVSNILTKAVGVILIPIYVKYLTPDDYGIISITTPLIGVFSVFFTFGLGSALARFYFDYEEKSYKQKVLLGNIFQFLLIYGFFLSIAFIFLLKNFLIKLFPGIDFYPFIFLAVLSSYGLVFFEFKLNLFRIRQKSLYYGIFSFIKFLLIVLLTILFVVTFSMGALGKVLSEFIVIAVFFIISAISITKEIIFKIDFKLLKSLLKYALPVVPHLLSSILTGFVGKMILNYYDGLTQTGIFNIGFLVGSIMNMIVTSINLTWNPFFIRTAQAKGDEAKPIFAQLTSYYLMFILFTGLCISIFSREIIYLITLKNEVYVEAYKIIPIVTFHYIITGFYFMAANCIFYVKKAVKYIPLATVTASFVNIGFNLLLVPKIGMYGVALSQVIGNIISFIIAYIIAQKFYKIKYEYRRVFILLVVTALLFTIYIISENIKINPYIYMLLKLVILSGYFLLLYLIKFLRVSEIKNLKDIVYKVRKRYI